jgi:hypothetical protein
MVEFILEEWKKVVIHEVSKFSFDALVDLHALGIPPGGMGRPLLWANGIVFEHNVMPPTSEIIGDQLKGIVQWSSLQFSFMEKYERLVIKDNVTVHIADVSSNKVFCEMSKWLKKKFK